MLWTTAMTMEQQIVKTARAPTACGQCLFDAGHLCGLTGAARCGLLDGWAAGTVPAEWMLLQGEWACTEYEPAYVELEQ